MRSLPVLDVLPSDDVVLMLRWAVEEFQQDPVVKHAELDGGIATDAHNPLEMCDGLLVFPSLIYDVLESII